MMGLYFPETVYVAAHKKFVEDTGIDRQIAYEYCMEHIDFFVEVAFAYVEGSPWPEMETT